MRPYYRNISVTISCKCIYLAGRDYCHFIHVLYNEGKSESDEYAVRCSEEHALTIKCRGSNHFQTMLLDKQAVICLSPATERLCHAVASQTSERIGGNYLPDAEHTQTSRSTDNVPSGDRCTALARSEKRQREVSIQYSE